MFFGKSQLFRQRRRTPQLSSGSFGTLLVNYRRNSFAQSSHSTSAVSVPTGQGQPHVTGPGGEECPWPQYGPTRVDNPVSG